MTAAISVSAPPNVRDALGLRPAYYVAITDKRSILVDPQTPVNVTLTNVFDKSYLKYFVSTHFIL